MPALIILFKTMLVGILASAVARMMIGAGIAFVTYQAIDGYLEAFLDAVAADLGQLPANMFTILAMMGIPTALEIVGSAMLTVFAIKIAGRIMGIKFVDNG